MPIRIQLASNRKTKVPCAKSIVLVSNYDDLIKTASQKFRFKPANVRLFVAKKLNGIAIGTELLNESDFEQIAVDGAMFVVSNKDDFKGTSGIKETGQILDDNLLFPPRYPFPTKIIDD